MHKNILQADTLHPSFRLVLEEAGFSVTEAFDRTKEEILQQSAEISGLAIRSRFRIDRDFLERARGLRCIGRAGAGMENIDTLSAAELGIQCVNAPEGNRDAVAEHALGMILALNNHLLRADREVRNGIWRREENRGVELEGKTIGIIGFGNMGRAFARRLQGFGMRILVSDPYVKIDTSAIPYVEQCGEELLFEECDFISLHVPLSDETRYMVNDSWLQKFRKPLRIINTARGKVLDTAALVRAIESGKVLGAALDVLEYESLSFESLDASLLPEAFQYLVRSDKVILSPHIGGWTHESNEKIARILAGKMIGVLK